MGKQIGNKTFLTISKKECQIFYKTVLENSEQRWVSAETLAGIGDYGGAISMSIISTEELVKCLVICMDGYGFEFRRIRGMDTVFRHHKVRHVAAFLMFVGHIIGDELIRLAEFARGSEEELRKLMDTISPDPDDFFKRYMKMYFLRKLALVRSELEWFSDIDFFRQDGFYCDYNNKISTPSSVSIGEWNHVVTRLKKVKKVGVLLLSIFESTDPIIREHLDQMRIVLKQHSIYEMIGATLDKVRQSRESPFEMMNRYFGIEAKRLKQKK